MQELPALFQEHCRVLAEASPIALLISRVADGTILYANARVAATFGVAAAETVGRKTLEFYRNPSDREKLLQLVQKNGHVSDYELLAQRADGAAFWALASLQLATLHGESVLLSGFYDVTTRKQTEEALRASEERYRALFENNPSMYFTVNTAGRVLSVNRFGAEQLGYAPADLIGESVLGVFYEEDKPEVLRQLQHCVQHPDRVHEWEFRKVRRDGGVLWVKEAARAMREADGQMLVLIVCEDITYRKRAEQEIRRLNQELERRVIARTAELHESEEKFRQLAENIDAVFWMNAPSANELVYISPAYEKIWGRPASHLEEKPRAFLDDIYPEDKPLMLALLSKQERGESYEGEYRIVRPDGEMRWIHDRGFPITDARGKVYRFAGIAQDVTESWRAEEALRASEERYRTLAESAQDFVYILNRKGEIAYLNRAAAASFNRAPAEVIGKHLSQAFSAQEYPRLWERVQSVFATGLATRNEIEVQFPEQRLWVDNQLIPLRDQNQNVYAVMGVSRNITARKQMEAELRQYAAGLETLVEERTRQMRELERQRIENEKLAATGRMAARIAHEINNPLGFLQVAFQLISRDVDPRSKHRHYLAKIEKEIERIALIIRQMLDVHRPQQEMPQAFRPAETVHDVLMMMRPHTQARGVLFDLDLERAQHSVALPENMLRQVLYNVILNAIEASASGGKVKVLARATAQQLALTVRDHGSGIPEEIQARMFEPFFTTKSATPHSGMGLGLSICKSLVEAMNGSIKITSQPGAGTTCEIVLPVEN